MLTIGLVVAGGIVGAVLMTGAVWIVGRTMGLEDESDNEDQSARMEECIQADTCDERGCKYKVEPHSILDGNEEQREVDEKAAEQQEAREMREL